MRVVRVIVCAACAVGAICAGALAAIAPPLVSGSFGILGLLLALAGLLANEMFQEG